MKENLEALKARFEAFEEYERLEAKDRKEEEHKKEHASSDQAPPELEADDEVRECVVLVSKQIEDVKEAYARWMLARAVGSPELEHRDAQRLSTALFQLFDGGQEADDEPCDLDRLLAFLHAAPRPEGDGVAEAARVLLDYSGEYMPVNAKLAAVKAHLKRHPEARPVAIAEAWLAALRTLAAPQDGEG